MGIPLGAHVAIAILLSIVAAPLLFRGYCDVGEHYAPERLRGALYMAAGVAVLGLNAFIWSTGAP